MAPGKRPTGTVPKTRKNTEMVAPTRRDLQEHLNEFFASVAERAAKPENNQTRAVSENCFELDNLGLQENTRYWPVRPIPRRNFLHDDNNMNDQHSSIQNVGGNNTAIGVVIPTTPSSSVLQHQYNDTPQQQLHFNNLHRQRINRTPDSIGGIVESVAAHRGTSVPVDNNQQHQSQLNVGNLTNSNIATANVEERINQIQEYIRITSTLINSIQAEKPSPENTDDIVVLTKNLDNLRDSEQKLLEIKKSDEYTMMDNLLKFSSSSVNNSDSSNNNAGILNSATLENVSSPESNGPRPQSVASVSTSAPNTPTYEELQTKLEFSNRNMLHIKEQQQQLLRLQQTAKQQLQEMEQIRDQHGPMSFAGNANAAPDYDNAEDVQNDVESLMTRMKTLNDFIRNQNELASLLGADKNEVLEEQMQLQQKLMELKNKKQQMANLVNELQQMNGNIAPNVNESVKQLSSLTTKNQPDSLPMRNVPIDYERIVPIEMVQNQRSFSTPRYNNSATLMNNNTTRQPIEIKRELEPIIGQQQQQQVKHQQLQQQCHENVDDVNENEHDSNDDEDDEEGATADENQDTGISEKIAEINAMKNQLKRLQDMMATVKLIELKNGNNDDPDSIRSSRSQSHFETPTPAPIEASETYASTNDHNQSSSLSSIPKSINNLNVVGGIVQQRSDADVEEEEQDNNEQEMDERVRALHSMTQDLRNQAISLAAERDRLKDIKNEMFRRREIESDKNTKSKRENNNNNGSLTHDQDHLQSEYNAKKMEFDKLVQKLDNDRENSRLKEMQRLQNNVQKSDQHIGDSMFSPDVVAWQHPSQQQNLSASSSTRSEHHEHHSMRSSSNKPTAATINGGGGAGGCVKGKDSTDSGAADVLGMSVDAGSLRSGSSRGFSVPPPMRSIARDSAPWRKTSQETSRISSINQANSNFDQPHDSYPPSWYCHTNYFNQGYGSMPPQSPHCHYHHHMGGDQHYCRQPPPPPPPMYHPNVQMQPPVTATSNNDPMLLQQFIQTQQMLINSVCQCNQLLWDQQREINNLNSAVILLQERILNTSNNEVIPQSIRPESVPPNVTCTNTQSYLPRAQSEQPLNTHVGCYTNASVNSTVSGNYGMAQTHQHTGRFAQQYPFACQNHSSQIYHRTPQQNNMANVNRVINLSNGNSQTSQQQQQQLLNKRQAADTLMNYYQNEIATANAVYPNNFINPLIQMHHIPLSQSSNASINSVPSNNNLLNNDPNVQCQSQTPDSPTPTPQSSSLYINNNNNNNNTVAASAAAAAVVAANNAANSSNININQLQQQQPTHLHHHHHQQQQQQHIAAAPLNNSVANNSAFSSPVPPALNNQVPPGNRANNYWDNFRSYSRQNLLSSNSCKSNEDAYGATNSPLNRDQIARNNVSLPSQMTHNILPASVGGTNKYSIHFRNQINQHSAAAAAAAAAAASTALTATTQSSSIGSSGSVITTTAAPTQSSTIAQPDVLNVNQHHHSHLPMHHHHHHDNSGLGINNESIVGASNYTNLNITPGGGGGGSSVNNQPSGNILCGQSTSNCNINLELNELRPNLSTKMQPKSTTGGNKRIRQLRERDQNIVSANQQAAAANGVDLNLASTTINRSDSKSSEKLFEALKENVYLEVSALITANESRPHFLINLFRELQLISTSDPLRNRLMQAFQELYNRYCEPTIQEENNSLLQSVQNDVTTPDTVQQDLTQSSDNRYNHSMASVDYTSADSTPVRVPDLHDEELLRSIMLEIAEFLGSIDQINESALQRITAIICMHINGPSSMIGNKPTLNLNKHYHLISHDELLKNLIQMDRRNRDNFMEGLETYLSTLICCNGGSTNHNSSNSNNNSNSNNGSVTSSSTTPIASVVHVQQSNEIEDELYQQQQLPKSMRRRQDNSFLDLTTPISGCKSNEVLSAMRRCVDETITLADVAAVIGGAGGGGASGGITHMPSAEDNQDLAEADQICNSTSGNCINDDYSTEDDFNVSSNMANGGGGGAVGGVISSTLPDLAKVTTPSHNALDEESVWMANEEVERLTGQPLTMIDGIINNALNGNDSKKNNH